MIHTLETRNAFVAVKKRRKKLGISQDKLAEKSGLCQSSISTFESGDTVMPFTHFFALLRSLGIEVAFKVHQPTRAV